MIAAGLTLASCLLAAVVCVRAVRYAVSPWRLVYGWDKTEIREPNR
jgi:lysophospholipid acyltransferase (LPLAT)-like uncharacterized protein